MVDRAVSPTFVGRTAELQAARGALERAAAGTPSHVLVAGEAGVGKSRFVSQVAALAGGLAFRVVQAGCVLVGEAGLPYGPIAEMLRELARDLEPDILARAIAGDGPELARLAPILTQGEQPALVQDQWAQSRLFDALQGFLHRLAADRPLLLIIDDLHWADPGTRDALTYLIPNLRGDRIALALTVRSDELHRRHPLVPWLVEVERSGRVQRIDLERFENADTRALLAGITGSEPAVDIVERIQRRSDGNPFFVEELVMAGAAGSGMNRLPATLREVLVARLATIPEDAQRVLRMAAVAGRSVDHALLGLVARLSDVELDEALRAAVSSQLLVSDDSDSDTLVFRHALIQEAAYDDLLPGERRRLHGAFAEALAARTEGRHGPPAGAWAELAHHWAAARVDDRAALASVRAGDEALQSVAYTAALRHFEQAIELWDSVADPDVTLGLSRIELLERAAGAADHAGDYPRSVAIRKEVGSLSKGAGDPGQVALRMEQLGRSLWMMGDTEASLAAYNEAMALLPTERPTVERARVLAGMGQILMLVDRYEESIDMCSRAVEIAREVGARDVEGHALNSMGVSLAAHGRCQQGIAALEQSLAIGTEVGVANDIARAYVNLTDAFRFCGLDRRGADLAEEGIRRAEELGLQSSYRHPIALGGALVNYGLGRWADAARLAEVAERDSPTGRNSELYQLGYTICLTVATADRAIAERQLADFAVLLEGQPPEAQFAGQYAVARAEFELWGGRPLEASVAVEQGLTWLADGTAFYFKTRLHRMGAWALADLAEHHRAHRHEASAEAALRGAERHEQEAQEILARLGTDARDQREPGADLLTIGAEVARSRGASDPALWHASAERWDAQERPYYAACARWREAQAQLERGVRAAAIQPLREAARVAGELGARPLGAAIDGLARRGRIDLTTAMIGAEPPRTETAWDPYGLTAREREVLELVAEGRTNREIADALFISENTAGVHVSKILGKLNVSRRTEAASIAIRLARPS